MTENERPLIEVARERFARGVRISVTDNIVAAGAYVAGYEDGVDAAADIRGMHAATEEIGTLRARIAELKAELAESKERIVAVMHAAKWEQDCPTAPMHQRGHVEREGSETGMTMRFTDSPDVIGVEVTDEMVERVRHVCNERLIAMDQVHASDILAALTPDGNA